MARLVIMRAGMMMRTIGFGVCVAAAAAGCSSHDRNGAGAPGGGEVDRSPHLAAKSCDLPQGDSSTVARVGGSLGRVETCWVYSDGTVKIEMEATPGATLVVGDKKQQVGDDGRTSVTVDLDPALLHAPVASAIGDGAGITAPTVAVRLELPGGAKPLEGTLEISLEDAAVKRTRAMLAAVPAGTALPRGDLGPSAPAVDRGSLVVIPAVEYTAMRAIGKATTLAQLDLVAVVKDGARTAAPDCGPYDNFGMLPHQNVASSVTIYEVATAKKIAEKTFDADFEGCAMMVSGYAGQKPTVESRPSDAAISDYLATIAAGRASS